jgi:hypothetical protein
VSQPELAVTFYDHEQPIATAGVYTVELEQSLVHEGADVDAGDKLPKAQQRFEIRAARFVLDPASISFTYPPPGTMGDYSRTLAHVTLARPVLPWERRLEVRALADDVRPPWLALLVFGEDELDDDPTAVGESVTRTVEQLVARDDPTVLGPALGTLDAGVAASTCQTVDVPVAVFTGLVPRETELRHLAHVRYVKTAPQTRVDGEKFTEGEYAIVAANRFPRGDGGYVAHLVSLEGFAGRLGPDQIEAQYRHIRLCSLHRWSFRTDTVDAFDAAQLLAGLAAPGRTDGEKLALRLPAGPGSEDPSAAERSARERLELGYAPVKYRLPSGETSFAWYRGPCVPVQAPEVPVVGGAQPRTTADHALIYEPEHGVFDVSYAAAWTLGRALGLRDPEYAEDVTRARRELGNVATRMMAMAELPWLSGHAAQEPGERYAVTQLAGLVHGRIPPPVTDVRRHLSLADQIRFVAARSAVTALTHAAAARAGSMPTWLEQLALLREVPFSYLVPHPEMLPPESLRMFRIDAAWIAALVSGARDVAAFTSVDAATAGALRAATVGAGKDPAAGVLIRSRLVPAWPEFDLIAYAASGTQIEELRRSLLAPDTLLILFEAVPGEVVIREPGQGIHFGLDTHGTRRDVIALRKLDQPGIGDPTHEHFPATGGVFGSYLRPDSDVLDLARLVAHLGTKLGKPQLSPAQFALQLVNAPVSQTFNPGGTS